MRLHLFMAAFVITGCSPDARILGPDEPIADRGPVVAPVPVDGVRYALTQAGNGSWTASVPGTGLSVQVVERDDGRWLHVDLVPGSSTASSGTPVSASVRHVRILERMPPRVVCTGSGIGEDWLWVVLPPPESSGAAELIGGCGHHIFSQTEAGAWRLAYLHGATLAEPVP
ncbi:MAG: hypothetical protein RLZZ127_2501 [Planctomycetota bacterium]|jgi:hypothetical protein